MIALEKELESVRKEAQSLKSRESVTARARNREPPS